MLYVRQSYPTGTSYIVHGTPALVLPSERYNYRIKIQLRSTVQRRLEFLDPVRTERSTVGRRPARPAVWAPGTGRQRPVLKKENQQQQRTCQ